MNIAGSGSPNWHADLPIRVAARQRFLTMTRLHLLVMARLVRATCRGTVLAQ
jgi:hypothetical protein